MDRSFRQGETTRSSGRDILEILEANLAAQERLVRVSGGRCVFDRKRIVSTGLAPDRVYTVVVEGQVVERETMLLAGRFRRLKCEIAAVPFSLALYGRAARSKRIEAKHEGRVRLG